jgi:hypothetical protein
MPALTLLAFILATPVTASAELTANCDFIEPTATPARTYLPPDVLRELESVVTTTANEPRPEVRAPVADDGLAAVVAAALGDADAARDRAERAQR